MGLLWGTDGVRCGELVKRHLPLHTSSFFILVRFFFKLHFGRCGVFLLFIPLLTLRGCFYFLNSDVLYALSGLNPWMLYGPNGVLPFVREKKLWFCADTLLRQTFHLCLSTPFFPSIWNYAYVYPVLKKDNCSKPSNYCPISLLHCLSKAIKKILNKKYVSINQHSVLSDHTYVFHKW